MVVAQSLEVALEIPSQDIQAQSQVAVEVMEILNLVAVVAEEADLALPALQHHLLTLLLQCFSQL
jgi:hypothetical protein